MLVQRWVSTSLLDIELLELLFRQPLFNYPPLPHFFYIKFLNRYGYYIYRLSIYRQAPWEAYSNLNAAYWGVWLFHSFRIHPQHPQMGLDGPLSVTMTNSGMPNVTLEKDFVYFNSPMKLKLKGGLPNNYPTFGCIFAKGLSFMSPWDAFGVLVWCVFDFCLVCVCCLSFVGDVMNNFHQELLT